LSKPNRLVLSAIFLLAAAPSFAGIHYKSVTRTEAEGAKARNSDIQTEGWVAGDKAKVVFVESNGNPMAQKGTYILTKDGGKLLYLVSPEDKTYAEWSLQGMMGVVGTVMNGIGPLLKIQFTDPKTEKIAEEDGGLVAGIPTRHYKFRTTYTMSVKVLGMGNSSNVVNEQDVWATTKLTDVGLGVWLRSDPPRTGNADFDKLIAGQAGKVQGFPLKMITTSTSTDTKRNRTTRTTTTMQVTELDAHAAVSPASFEIPAGYKQTQLTPEGEGHP
jgi:hypothetical protein